MKAGKAGGAGRQRQGSRVGRQAAQVVATVAAGRQGSVCGGGNTVQVKVEGR